MIKFTHTINILTLAGILFAGTLPAPAQNMSGTVVERRVRFARGTHSATLQGRAKYGMSYAYKLGARAGQNMNVLLTSNGNAVTFSLIAPNTDTVADAFLVNTWSGVLDQSGDYSIVVVMNNERARNVPFTLAVSIR
jgi:hypothetical protein